MSFKSSDFLVSVVIEHPKLEIIRPSDEPILARYEFNTTNRDFCNFETLDNGTCFMVINVDSAVVESCKKPGFCRVEIDAFDAIRPRK
jgi:hypothetical protein